jgi:hypothetical protein
METTEKPTWYEKLLELKRKNDKEKENSDDN